MKITIVQGAFFPVPPIMGGAIEKAWFSLGKEFAKRGHKVLHISRLHNDLSKKEIIKGVEHKRAPGFNAPKSLMLLKIFDLIYSWRVLKILPEADILITNTFWLPILVRTKKYGAIYAHVGRYPKGQLRLYKHADRLHTVSNAIAKEITRQEPWSEKKVRVIPYPLSEGAKDTCEKLLGLNRKNWILYAGRVHPEKGIDLLLNAFRILVTSGMNNWRLVIVGPWQTKLGGGGEKYYGHLRKRFKEIENMIDWVGPVFDVTKLDEYYSSAAFFVYPSLAEKGETFGLAVLEAMSRGCVPLVSNLDCFKDFVEDKKTGFIFDHRAINAAALLAKQLKELTGSEELLAKIRENGYCKAQNYRVEHVAGLYLSDFESLGPRNNQKNEKNI